jgi:hypothetical protein
MPARAFPAIGPSPAATGPPQRCTATAPQQSWARPCKFLSQPDRPEEPVAIRDTTRIGDRAGRHEATRFGKNKDSSSVSRKRLPLRRERGVVRRFDACPRHCAAEAWRRSGLQGSQRHGRSMCRGKLALRGYRLKIAARNAGEFFPAGSGSASGKSGLAHPSCPVGTWPAN